MSADAIITLVVIGIALFLFITEYYTVDVVALGIICALVLTGVISPREGVSGFANSATVTVASLFVISDAGEPGFSMFQFLPMGLVFVCVGTLYLCLFGRKLVPERVSEQDFAESGRIHDFEV